MPVPVDADAAVCESLVSPVERDVMIYSRLVLAHERLDALEGRLLLDCEEEDDVGSGLSPSAAERANHREHGLDVARVVPYAGRVEPPASPLDLDLQPVLK